LAGDGGALKQGIFLLASPVIRQIALQAYFAACITAYFAAYIPDYIALFGFEVAASVGRSPCRLPRHSCRADPAIPVRRKLLHAAWLVRYAPAAASAAAESTFVIQENTS
jgi:hypothetical protein